MTAVVSFWTAYIALPVLLWTAARRLGRRGGDVSTDAVVMLCGRCGYDVRELPTNVCPECGGDLSVVGHVTGSQLSRRRWRRKVVPIAWGTLMAGLGALLTVAALFNFSPRQQVGRAIILYAFFIGHAEAPWPFLIVNDVRWDRDESPKAFGSWYPQRQRIDRISSTGRTPKFTANVQADADQALTWDVARDTWMYESPGHSTQRGRGFPPVEIIRLWAMDVVGRRPPATPLTPRQLDSLVLAGGDTLSQMTTRLVEQRWQIDRPALVAAGATVLKRAQIGGSFRNDIIPFWPPTAAVVVEWIVLMFLSWRTLRRRSS